VQDSNINIESEKSYERLYTFECLHLKISFIYFNSQVHYTYHRMLHTFWPFLNAN